MRERRTAPRCLAALLVAVALPAAAGAQIVIDGTQDLAFDRTESWAMKYFASVTQMPAFGVPESRRAGEVELAVEYGQIPSLSRAERRVGFNGTKVEDLNRVPYLVRPVVRVGVGRDVTLTAGWLPPVERNGTEPDIVTLALARPLAESGPWRLGLRLHGQTGSVEGDFTCSERAAASDDPLIDPLGCEEASSDEHQADTVGLELSAARSIGRDGRWEPWLALGYQWMDLEFRIDARYSGVVDRTRLTTDGTTWSASVGLDYLLADRWSLAAAAFYSPLDVVRPPSTGTETDGLLNLRAALSWGLR